MTKCMSIACLFFSCLASSTANAEEQLDKRIVGAWQGMRDQNEKCQFLAWQSNFMPNGRFEISFFADKERTKLVQTERGIWKTKDGKNELRTDGVPTAELYLYTIVSDETIKYVNTVKDPSADCQADYEFTEHRVKK